jgi:eukaryotic-like serine/threonine-protein kinase
MTACPRDEQLRALLDEQLGPDDRAPIVTHIGSCSTCHERLAALTRSGEPNPSCVPPDADETISPSGPPSSTAPGLESTCELDSDGTISPSGPPSSMAPGLESTCDLDPDGTISPSGPPSSAAPGPESTCDFQADRAVSPTGPSTSLAPGPESTCDFNPGLAVINSESQLTTDFSRPKPGKPIRAVPSTTDAAGVSDEGPGQNDDTTMTQTGPPSTATSARRDQSRARWPAIPGYEILGKLGEGGMGVVYKARQQGLNRLVALKMIIGGSQVREHHLARFRIEAEAVAQLRHPNIVQIYDIGEVDGMPYVSLELLEGGDLQDRLAGTPQPSMPAALLVATLARAMHAAHQARIVHRDLKPANVLLTADGQPKITDFGLAKRLESDDNQTQTGDVMGTPSYMAPEQALGRTKDVGPAADIYALGAILYDVLTGRPPLKGETAIETVRLVIHADPVPPSRLVPRIARDLETICLKCLQKDPLKRYASAAELADDLDRFREGKPIKARPTPSWERGLKWSKRRPVAATFLALGLVAFIGLTGGAIGYQRHVRLESDRRNSLVLRQTNRGIELLDQADKSSTPAALQKAQVDLATFLSDAKNEDRLKAISDRIADKKKWVGDQLEALRSRDTAEQHVRLERERFQKFLELRHEGQLYAAGFGVLDATDRLKKLRASAHAALSTYAQDPKAPDDAWTQAQPLPAALSGPEKARVADDCYDLLLILSQAAASPAEGLRLLDRAVRLRPQATAAYHLRRAECLERAGDLVGRDRENREASLIKPVTALDFFLSGRELMLGRRFADAVRPLNRALQADPEKTSAHLLLAVCSLNMQPKALSQARTSLTTCIRSHRDLVGLYLMRALVSGEEGNEALAKIAQTHPDEAEASRLRQEATEAIAAAEADYRQALDLKPNDDLRYALLTNRGLMWLQSNRLGDAVVDLEAAIRLKPSLYQAHAMLAQVYQRQGRLDAAAASFTQGIACHPQPIVAAGLYRSRALLYAYRGDITPGQHDAALRDLDEAIRQEPDKLLKVRDHVDRAKLFFAVKQSQQAITACDAALALVPDDAAAHRVRISALMELKRYDDVLTSADAYIARGKPSAEVFEIRGLAREARRRYADAVADFSRALELTPDALPALRSRLLNLRGWAYHFADALNLALPDFEESLRLNPDQSDALGGRGLARIRQGQWRLAVTDAEAAVRLVRAVVPPAGADRQARVQALANAARIYALAVEFAAQEVTRQGERAVVLYRNYRSRALDLLDEALKQVADPERRDAILNDPALRALRRGTNRIPGPRFSSLTSDRKTR